MSARGSDLTPLAERLGLLQAGRIAAALAVLGIPALTGDAPDSLLPLRDRVRRPDVRARARPVAGAPAGAAPDRGDAPPRRGLPHGRHDAHRWSPQPAALPHVPRRAHGDAAGLVPQRPEDLDLVRAPALPRSGRDPRRPHHECPTRRRPRRRALAPRPSSSSPSPRPRSPPSTSGRSAPAAVSSRPWSTSTRTWRAPTARTRSAGRSRSTHRDHLGFRRVAVIASSNDTWISVIAPPRRRGDHRRSVPSTDRDRPRGRVHDGWRLVKSLEPGVARDPRRRCVGRRGRAAGRRRDAPRCRGGRVDGRRPVEGAGAHGPLPRPGDRPRGAPRCGTSPCWPRSRRSPHRSADGHREPGASSTTSSTASCTGHAGLGDPVTVVLLDADHFKGINDQHGHVAGDAVRLAHRQRARLNTKAFDVVARVGGDEFAVVLPTCPPEAGAGVANLALRGRCRRGRGPDGHGQRRMGDLPGSRRRPRRFPLGRGRRGSPRQARPVAAQVGSPLETDTTVRSLGSAG